METKGINVLEEMLKKHHGKDAMISISHQLYGNQALKCKLNYIFDESRIGFIAKSGQEIFVYRNNLLNYGTKDGIYFADDLMEVKIKIV